jgi:hypothetical protein
MMEQAGAAAEAVDDVFGSVHGSRRITAGEAS